MGSWPRLSVLADRAIHAAFGESATVTVGGTAYTVIGIFDEAGQAVNGATGEMVTTLPKLAIRTEDVDDVAITPHVDTVSVRSVDYLIGEVLPDGAGQVLLILTES